MLLEKVGIQIYMRWADLVDFAVSSLFLAHALSIFCKMEDAMRKLSLKQTIQSQRFFEDETSNSINSLVDNC